MNNSSQWICGLLLILAAPALTAQNFSFLSKGPIAYLNDADEQILRAAFLDALDNQPDGKKVEWRNPDSGHGGTITLIDTHEDYGTTCRTLSTHTQAAGRTGGGVYRLCKAEDDTWQFAPRRRKDSS